MHIYIYIHTYMYYIYTHMYVCVRIYIHTHTHTYVNIFIYIYISGGPRRFVRTLRPSSPSPVAGNTSGTTGDRQVLSLLALLLMY
jgi:hypothetical protein